MFDGEDEILLLTDSEDDGGGDLSVEVVGLDCGLPELGDVEPDLAELEISYSSEEEVVDGDYDDSSDEEVIDGDYEDSDDDDDEVVFLEERIVPRGKRAGDHIEVNPKRIRLNLFYSGDC